MEVTAGIEGAAGGGATDDEVAEDDDAEDVDDAEESTDATVETVPAIDALEAATETLAKKALSLDKAVCALVKSEEEAVEADVAETVTTNTPPTTV